MMKIGTKTLLFGNHQVILHPILVFTAWIKLYRKPPNWKELICIVIHDWGYWGKPNLDGEEGENHPMWAASWTRRHFGTYYGVLCLFHSRFKAKQRNREPSKLCLADKYGVALSPVWLWVLLGKLTGETEEYKGNKKYEIFEQDKLKSDADWFRDYRKLCKKWVEAGEVMPLPSP